MKQSRIALGAVAVLAFGLAAATAVEAQEGPLPLTPLPKRGDIVAPYFDGWFANPDGTFTLSFGYFNRNTDEIIDIPIGPDNFIEPAEFNGFQPTHFRPANYGGFSGRRERGVFAIVVPADFRDKDVVWTLRVNGQTHSVPGRTTAGAYQLSHTPMAAGSLVPLVKLDESAPEGKGRIGVTAPQTYTVKVGEALPLKIFGQDNGERDRRFPLNATWVKHQGPGDIAFSPVTSRSEEPADVYREFNTTATFSAPGEYIVRARVDSFTASDSSFADQCCWSNGYFKVNVTQ